MDSARTERQIDQNSQVKASGRRGHDDGVIGVAHHRKEVGTKSRGAGRLADGDGFQGGGGA